MTPMASPGSGQEPPVTATADGHYFSTGPTAASRPGSVRLTLADRTMELATDAGVFSPGRVDPGTKLLLMELPELTVGPVVDVGCGYGPIACTIAARQPHLEVLAVDVNPRARELCRRNAETLGLDVRVLGAEEAEAVPRVGTIVSNPPIRIGKAALHALLTTWLDRLGPDGRAYLVVHKNLGADSLATWLDDGGHPVRRLRSRQGYRILEVGARC